MQRETYFLTRWCILRLLGILYAVAFLVAANQIVPLIGAHGLTPLPLFITRVQDALGSNFAAFVRLPSLFWFANSDTALLVTAWIGFALAMFVVAGYANAIVMAVLWALYMSFVHLGQEWYGYGWETQLLENGFLAIFLCPLLDPRPFSRRPPPVAIIWLHRALIFRIMLGSGLIKIRGDDSWRDLTALYYHFETQPIPNGLSRWFHFLPRAILKGGTLFNHIAELAAPWFVFWPRMGRYIAGVVIIAFQLVIIASGNLSFLNWLTIVPALACFDDHAWRKILPRVLTRHADAAAESPEPSASMLRTSYAIAALVALLSINPVINMFSSHQIMNTSFDPLDLVNTYGAFGAVGKERLNVVFEGSADGETWREYPYKGLPVALNERPPQIAPYQLRLDWQMWFAAMGSPREYPWTLNLCWKLLHNDAATLSLFRSNPFPDAPPRYVRAAWYRYKFVRSNPQGLWWERDKLGDWLPQLSADNQEFVDLLKRAGWLE
ncbi:MAG: lipase maturation factor family protein [Chthoniobacterales bacterium]